MNTLDLKRQLEELKSHPDYDGGPVTVTYQDGTDIPPLRVSRPITEIFVDVFNLLAEDIHQTARDKGWWGDREQLMKLAEDHSPEMGAFAKTAIAGMNIGLIHSEISEALEGIRGGNYPDDKIPEFNAEEAEYADAIIRIMDTAQARGLRVAEALVAKSEMNKGRSFKHGGKKI